MHSRVGTKYHWLFDEITALGFKIRNGLVLDLNHIVGLQRIIVHDNDELVGLHD
jgi:hypothetical protein